jgi:hypothetical protein
MVSLQLLLQIVNILDPLTRPVHAENRLPSPALWPSLGHGLLPQRHQRSHTHHEYDRKVQAEILHHAKSFQWKEFAGGFTRL